MEEEAVFALFELAKPKHQLRSVFTQGSIGGWVYLETTMNEDLRKLLKLTCGIVQRENRGILCEEIDFAEWTTTLKFTHNVEVGKWVRVTKGTYKGDVGYVLRFETSGEVSLLLVPRLPGPLPLGQSSSKKRKRSIPPPEPKLFNCNATQETHRNPNYNPDDPTNIIPSEDPIPPEDYFVHDGNHFEHGLIVKSYTIHSLSTVAVSIQSKTFTHFRMSGHPLILASKLPKPIEWIFEEGEKVLITASGKQGTVHKVEADGVEVELDNGEGKVKVGWLYVNKVCINGDYVEVLSGMHKGQSGWIQLSAFGLGSACIIEDHTDEIKVKGNLLPLCF